MPEWYERNEFKDMLDAWIRKKEAELATEIPRIELYEWDGEVAKIAYWYRTATGFEREIILLFCEKIEDPDNPGKCGVFVEGPKGLQTVAGLALGRRR